MPISQKIITQVLSSDAKKDEKFLMLDILKIEDQGSFCFAADYEKAINDFIKRQDKGGASDGDSD